MKDKISCNFTMEDEVYKELMDIQSALDNPPIIKSELACKTDDSQIIGNRSTFKKPISCSKYGMSFMSTSKVEIHARIHTGEKPFSCSECEKKFSHS